MLLPAMTTARIPKTAKSGIGDDKSQQRPWSLCSRLLSQRRRKNHIACAKENGKQHKGNINNLRGLQFLVQRESLPFYKVS